MKVTKAPFELEEVQIMFSLVAGLLFIVLGILPYGFLNFWLLKDGENLENTKYQISPSKQ
ncbi:MAG: hypothetical protein Tsb0014_42960 [Pleurocapsa sp.]